MTMTLGCSIALLVVLVAPVRTVSAADPLTADEVIHRAEERFRQLTDYDCLADTDSRAGKKTASGTYHLWFKKPEMVRIRVIQGGHRGSEVAVDRDGKVRGREGGLLKPFVVGLSKTDGRLQSIRGVSITQLDWGTFYHGYHEAAAHAGAHVTLAPPGSSGAYDVTVTYAQDGKRMREVYRVDSARWVLLEANVFEDEVRVDHILFRDIKLDTGLEDRWFRL
jgi:outer membrane lipoprotein-sorting protein